MAFTFCTSGAAKIKAGINTTDVDTNIGNSLLENWSDEAENLICATARNDLITDFSSLTANGKQILQMLASSLIAQNIISYDQTGYLPREAETMLDKLENDIRRGLALISDDKIKTYLTAT